MKVGLIGAGFIGTTLSKVMEKMKEIEIIYLIDNSPAQARALADSLKKVNEYELDSERINTLAAMGKIENIHEVMIAAEKSKIALQFTVEVKNKVLDAYKEIMRLQV